METSPKTPLGHPSHWVERSDPSLIIDLHPFPRRPRGLRWDRGSKISARVPIWTAAALGVNSCERDFRANRKRRSADRSRIDRTPHRLSSKEAMANVVGAAQSCSIAQLTLSDSSRRLIRLPKSILGDSTQKRHFRTQPSNCASRDLPGLPPQPNRFPPAAKRLCRSRPRPSPESRAQLTTYDQPTNVDRHGKESKNPPLDCVKEVL